MNTITDPTSAAAFETRYRNDTDPWNFASSPYERGRYAVTLRSLLRARYGTVYEPGCSVGELTHALAARCDRVVASDLSPTAVARARERCRDCSNVYVHVARHPMEVPVGMLDLVVFSEIGYYFAPEQLDRFASALAGQLLPGGEFIAVHWLGHSTDHVIHGDVVHERLAASLPLSWVGGQRYEGFRIDTWIRR